VCRALTKGGRVRARLSADAVARLFTQMAQAAGLSPQLVQGIAGHSARVGAAQDMAVYGIDLAGIMQVGRWKTPQMAGRDIERITARRGAAAQLAARQHRLDASGVSGEACPCAVMTRLAGTPCGALPRRGRAGRPRAACGASQDVDPSPGHKNRFWAILKGRFFGRVINVLFYYINYLYYFNYLYLTDMR